ncbi:MAG TPA: MATE family efflux transporter, partial [Oscillospiraceae bacterium]|nr:MATE family efflux transporter [Oscillospiraceae bacterium]
ATVISYIVTSICVLFYFFSKKSSLKIKANNLKLNKSTTLQIIKLGIPTFTIQITSSIQHLILNRSLSRYGGELALAAIGIIMSVTTFLVMPAMGIGQGAQPILGFNKGAKEYNRVKDTLKLSIVSATTVIAIGFVISKIWPAQIVSIFNKNPRLIEMGVHGMGIFFKFIPLVGVQMLGSNYFQAVGKANKATILGLSRQIFIFIPLLIILPYYWGLEGVWWSAPLSDIGAFIFTGVWLLFELKELNKMKYKEETAYNLQSNSKSADSHK